MPSPLTTNTNLPLRALYVDFNAYFASVEQQRQPHLRGKPVAVLPVLAETTCCIAASYEARAFGIKTGTPVYEARKRCPAITFVESNPTAYIELHHRLIAIVESCLHVEQVCSIDEMWCVLNGRDQLRGNAEQLAQTIKTKIRAQVGEYVRCSIGIAPNRFLAKTASDMQKPDGLVVIEGHELPERLYALQLRDLNGIGRAMEKRLHSCGIHTVAQLYAADAHALRFAWRGVEGERMYDKLRGVFTLSQEAERASVSHSHVLAPEMRHADGALMVLHRLTQKAMMRLRSLSMVSNRMQISVKFTQRNQAGRSVRWGNEAKLDASSDTRTALHVLEQLWQTFPKQTKHTPLLVYVGFTELQPLHQQTRNLFEENAQHSPKAEQLNAVLDSLNQRFGKHSVYFGGAHQALQHAPMRIAFNRVPELDEEGGAAQ